MKTLPLPAHRTTNETVDRLGLKNMNGSREERLRELGRKSGGMAQAFDDTLSPIVGLTERLLLDPELLRDQAEVSRYLELIRASAKEAATMVDQLRDFYRPATAGRHAAKR